MDLGKWKLVDHCETFYANEHESDEKKIPPKVKESTLVHTVFGNQVRSQVKCMKCNAKSNTFQTQLDFSVDIERISNLHSAFKRYTAMEKISGYSCSKCKRPVDAGKQMMISKLPNSLIVHLKRFGFNRYTGDAKKLGHKVEYPETLDMAPFLSPEDKERQLKFGTKYHLHSVVVHDGYSCDFGHYYAYTKGSDSRWYEMNDATVSILYIIALRSYEYRVDIGPSRLGDVPRRKP